MLRTTEYAFKYISLLFLIIFILFPKQAFSADEPLLPEEESPSTFLEARQDSEDVQMFFTGSWKIETSASFGTGWTSDTGFNPALTYPGISSGFAFSQSPDFTASVLILNRYLFEAAFSDEFDDSTFRLGYIGQEGEIVQSVSVGNMGINMSEDVPMNDYFHVPGGGPSSFGIHSVLCSPFSEHELLFRFDPEEEQRQVYIGSDSVTEIEMELSDYVKGRYFEVPGSPSASVFYIESGSDGTQAFLHEGRYYSLLSDQEYSWSPSTGSLVLEEKSPGALLVLAEDPDWSGIDPGWIINSVKGTMLMLYEPGILSPFENSAAYNLGTVLPDEYWRTKVYITDAASSSASRIELASDIIPDKGIIILDSSVYGSYDDRKLLFVIREESSSYSIDDPVDGTVRIYINEIETSAWTESNGVITFDTRPGSEDRIEIYYRKKSSGSTGGDILFASSNNFIITDHLSAYLNGGVRWNISDSYALPGEETSGYGGITAGLSFSNSDENQTDAYQLNAGISGGVKLLSQNSAGRLLLLSMSADGYSVPLNRNTVFPASASENIGLAPEDRGLLLYKDYRVPTSFGSYYLQDYTAEIDESMIFSPSDSSASGQLKAGPYTASAVTDSRSGEILAMDYILPESNSWAGVQIPLAYGSENPDLSASRALSFDCKTDSDLSNITLYIETGSLSEDLDDDGNLDAETSAYSSGYIFNDPNSESGTLIGGDNLEKSNGIEDSEDFNGNGFLDSEKTDASVLFSSSADFVKPGTGWKTVRLYLSDAARSRLGNAGFIRITAVNNGTGETSGRIMFDDFTFEGSVMYADPDIAVKPDFSEISEALIPAAETPSAALTADTLSAGESNKVLRIEWTDDWKIRTVIYPVPPTEYGKVTFHAYCPELTPSGAAPPLLIFNMVDSEGSGIKSKIPLGSGTAWNKIELLPGADGGTGTVLVNNVENTQAELTFDSDSGDLSFIETGTENASGGVLYLDEVSLSDPVLHTTAGVSGDIEISSSGPLLTAGNLEIIGPAALSASADYNTGVVNLYSKISSEILGTSVSADCNLKDAGGVNLLAAGHTIDIPVVGSYLHLCDSFRTESASGGDFSKTGSLRLNAGVFSGTPAEFSTADNEGNLLRKWSSDITMSTALFSLDAGYKMLLSDSTSSFDWNNYFSGWADATALAVNFAPFQLEQRKIEIQLSPAILTIPVGFEFGIKTTSDINDENTKTDSAEISAGFPVSISTSGETISARLEFSRSADFTRTTESSGFTDDISDMFCLLSRRDYLYTSIPGWELFDPALPETVFDDCTAAEIDQAKLNNSIRAEFSRNYSSRLIDLLVPFSVSTGLERNSLKDYDDLEDSLDFDLVWRSAALNLFGAAGVYPFFDFYFSDEFNWSVEAALADPFSESILQKYIFSTGCSFFGHEEQILSVDSSFFLPVGYEDLQSEFKTDLIYVRTEHPATPFNLPLFDSEEENFQLIIHEEKLSVDVEASISTEFRHTTSLVLPRIFTLSAFGLFGVEYNNVSENKTLLYGLSLGLTGSIIY